MGLLDDMALGSTQRVASARSALPEHVLRARCEQLPPAPKLALSDRGFDLIAELKLRSPAMGDLSAHAQDPVRRLCAYATGGAAACSVLTEPSRFDGDLAHLHTAAAALAPQGVPVLRKDFLVDEYQLLEARAAGAGGVLLIVRMLPVDRLAAMLDEAAALGLFVLLEAFDAEDLAVAAELARGRADRDERVLMGLNCRDLQTLQVDFERFERLRDRLPPQWPAVAESGVTMPREAHRVAALGYRLALVGTTLMQSVEPQLAVRDFIEAGRAAHR